MIYSWFAIDYDDFYSKEMNCSDVVTNDNYNIMISKLRTNGKLIYSTFLLYLALVIIIVVYGIISLIFRDKKKVAFQTMNMIF